MAFRVRQRKLRGVALEISHLALGFKHALEVLDPRCDPTLPLGFVKKNEK